MSLEAPIGKIAAIARCRQRWDRLDKANQDKVIAALKALGGEEALVGIWLPEPSLLDVDLVNGMIDLLWNARTTRVDESSRRECLPGWTFEEIMESEG